LLTKAQQVKKSSILGNIRQNLIAPRGKTILIIPHGAERSGIPGFLSSISRCGGSGAKVGMRATFASVDIVRHEGSVAFIGIFLGIDGVSVFLCESEGKEGRR